MRLPTPAPSFADLFKKHLESDVLSPVLADCLDNKIGGPVQDGRYRHWHKLQYLEPPQGVSHESWWLAIKIARKATYTNLPLLSCNKRLFVFSMPDILWEMLHRIDRRAAGTMESENLLPTQQEKQSFLMRSLSEEAINSSQLEGAATTRKVAKKMLRDGRPAQNRSEQMILNNYHGMRFISEKAKHRTLDPQLIFELHGILTEGTLDDSSAVGRFRHESEQIAVVDSSGLVLHDPPPASELAGRLQALCDFANAESGPFIHPAVRSILLHFWLAYDHPFVDGNGRTARALFYWSMAKHGYWLVEFTSISRQLLRSRTPYNRAFLYSESDENDATYFVLHQCKTILQAIDELNTYLKNRIEKNRRSHEILRNTNTRKLGLNSRQLMLMRHAIDHPGTQYTFKEHQQYHNVQYQTARTDLLEVAELGLLLKTKVSRTFVFLAPDDLRARLENPGS